MLHENVQGNRVVKVFGQEAHEQRRFAEHNERLFRLFMRASLLRQLPITEVLAGISVSAIVWYGGSSVIAGTRTLPDLGAFVLAILLLYEPFKKLVRTNNTIQQGLAGAERVFELLDTVPEVVDAPDAVRSTPCATRSSSTTWASRTTRASPVLRTSTSASPSARSWLLVGMSGGGKEHARGPHPRGSTTSPKGPSRSTVSTSAASR
jgi:subfamily B ATP-binding cassette protein MsbA